jgi:hypothetical protein
LVIPYTPLLNYNKFFYPLCGPIYNCEEKYRRSFQLGPSIVEYTITLPFIPDQPDPAGRQVNLTNNLLGSGGVKL